MCRYIWNDALQRSIKTLSWGVDFPRVKVIKNGTEFHVQGFTINLHKSYFRILSYFEPIFSK